MPRKTSKRKKIQAARRKAGTYAELVRRIVIESPFYPHDNASIALAVVAMKIIGGRRNDDRT